MFVLPVHGYFKVSACNQSADTSWCPCIRQCRKHIDISHVALQKHLCNTWCHPKVSVDLEWRMRIPEIGHNSVFKQICDQLICTVSICQSCPCIDSLSHSPAGTFICTVVHGHSCCLKVLRCIRWDQISREKSQHMGNMSVPVSLSHTVYSRFFIPLFDLSAIANLDRSF